MKPAVLTKNGCCWPLQMLTEEQSARLQAGTLPMIVDVSIAGRLLLGERPEQYQHLALPMPEPDAGPGHEASDPIIPHSNAQSLGESFQQEGSEEQSPWLWQMFQSSSAQSQQQQRQELQPTAMAESEQHGLGSPVLRALAEEWRQDQTPDMPSYDLYEQSASSQRQTDRSWHYIPMTGTEPWSVDGQHYSGESGNGASHVMDGSSHSAQFPGGAGISKMLMACKCMLVFLFCWQLSVDSCSTGYMHLLTMPHHAHTFLNT